MDIDRNPKKPKLNQFFQFPQAVDVPEDPVGQRRLRRRQEWRSDVNADVGVDGALQRKELSTRQRLFDEEPRRQFPAVGAGGAAAVGQGQPRHDQ